MEKVNSWPRTVMPLSCGWRWPWRARALTRAVAALLLLMPAGAASPSRAHFLRYDDAITPSSASTGPVGTFDTQRFKQLYVECERHVCMPIYLSLASNCPQVWLRSRSDEAYEACSALAHEESKLCSRHCMYGARERATVPER